MSSPWHLFLIADGCCSCSMPLRSCLSRFSSTRPDDLDRPGDLTGAWRLWSRQPLRLVFWCDWVAARLSVLPRPPIRSACVHTGCRSGIFRSSTTSKPLFVSWGGLFGGGRHFFFGRRCGCSSRTSLLRIFPCGSWGMAGPFVAPVSVPWSSAFLHHLYPRVVSFCFRRFVFFL